MQDLPRKCKTFTLTDTDNQQLKTHTRVCRLPLQLAAYSTLFIEN